MKVALPPKKPISDQSCTGVKSGMQSSAVEVGPTAESSTRLICRLYFMESTIRSRADGNIVLIVNSRVNASLLRLTERLVLLKVEDMRY